MANGKEPWINIDESMQEQEATSPNPIPQEPVQPAPSQQVNNPTQPYPQPQQTVKTEEEEKPKKKSKLLIILIILAIIFAIIVAIGFFVLPLIVVGTMMQTTAVGGGIGEAQSKSAWKSAEPFSVIDFAQDQGGNLSIVVKNNSGSVLTLNSLKVDGKTLITSDSGSVIVENFAPNSTKVMTVAAPVSCNTGNTFSYTASQIIFNYDTLDIAGREQIGKTPLTGTCS